MKQFTFLLVVMLATMTLSAQEEESSFSPHGKPVIKVFTNWHQGFGSDEFEDESGFELKRGVVGYEHFFSPRISSKVIVDMTSSGLDKPALVAYMRNAYIAYKGDKLSAYFGVLGMKQFKTQESNWGYRYIYKSAMDHYKFNNSVDAGLYVKYDFIDWLSADVTISNGEGAKSQQDIEGKYRTGYGLTLEPIKGLTFRSYYDLLYANESTVGLPTENQNMLALFLGYETDLFRVGAEYNTLKNFAFDGSDDRDIYSLYSTVYINDKLNVFARYDNISAEVSGKSEYTVMGGIEYKIVKGVKVSPNYRYGDYAFSSPKGEGSFFYLNFEYKF